MKYKARKAKYKAKYKAKHKEKEAKNKKKQEKLKATFKILRGKASTESETFINSTSYKEFYDKAKKNHGVKLEEWEPNYENVKCGEGLLEFVNDWTNKKEYQVADLQEFLYENLPKFINTTKFELFNSCKTSLKGFNKKVIGL